MRNHKEEIKSMWQTGEFLEKLEDLLSRDSSVFTPMIISDETKQ